MISELNIDTNIHVYGAEYQFHCHGYQIIYKTPESRNLTSSKSVNGLPRALVGISPHATQPIPTNRHRHRRSERPLFLFLVCPADNAGIT